MRRRRASLFPGSVPPRASVRRRSAYADRQYTAEEAEFLMAVERRRRQLGRTPTPAEALAVAQALGWRKDGCGCVGRLPALRLGVEELPPPQ